MTSSVEPTYSTDRHTICGVLHQQFCDIWLDLDLEDVALYSPTLADRRAAMAKDGMDRVISDIMTVIYE